MAYSIKNAVTLLKNKGMENEGYTAKEIRGAIKFILAQETTTGKIEFADSIRRQFNRTHTLSDKQTEVLFSIERSLKDEQL